MALKILLQGDLQLVSSGYGKSNKLLLEIFQKLGHEVSLFAHYGLEGIPPLKVDGITVYSRARATYGDDVIEAHFVQSGADVVITNIDPFVLPHYGDRNFPWVPIVPVSGDPFPDPYKNSIRGAREIVTISRYGQQVLSDAGIQSEHIYLPINTEHYSPLNRSMARSPFGFPDDLYIIGHVGMNRGIRKGHDILLRAFQIFLTEVPNAILYLHTDTRQHDGIQLEGIIKELGLERYVKYPTSYDSFYGKSDWWMKGLYNAIDLYIQPSLNEGQGMPVWEAMATGQNIVATDATALSEIMEDADAISVPWKHKTPMPYMAWGYAVTADDLAEAMLMAYNEWGHKSVSFRNRQKAIESVSLEEVAQRWQQLLITVEKKVRFKPVGHPWKDKPKVVQVSTRVKNCGIGDYTRSLMAAMSAEATEQECLDILEVGAKINELPKADIIHFHYEPSIWPSDETMQNAMWEARYAGAKTVCTYHAVIPSVIQSHLKNNLVDVAAIHWPTNGLTENDERMWILGGMGCPSFTPPNAQQKEEIRARYGFSMRDKIITTFGFATPGRGHFEVLEQLAPSLKGNPQVKVQLIVPGNFLNASGMNIVHNSIHSIAKDYHIGQQIHLVPEFIPDLDVLNRLWLSDIGFLYMPHDTWSCSSAISFFVSARLPLVVTPSSHFTHIRRGVLRTGEFSLIDFARTIWETLPNQSLLNTLRRDHEATYRQFVWPAFSEQYLSIYKKARTG